MVFYRAYFLIYLKKWKFMTHFRKPFFIVFGAIFCNRLNPTINLSVESALGCVKMNIDSGFLHYDETQNPLFNP
jgi:hypothetical protein